MPDHTETRRVNPFVFWGIGLIVLALLAFGIRYFTRERVSVYIAEASYQDLLKTDSTNGKVELIDEFQPHAQTPGVVQEIYVNVGDKVKPGQLLLRLDDADARARLASAESALKAAQLTQSDMGQGGSQDERNTMASDTRSAQLQQKQDSDSLASLEKLQQQGAASQAEVASARSRLQLDQNRLQSLQQHSTQRYGDADRAGAAARLADAQAAVAAAQSAVANANIRSPISGTIYAVPVSKYDYVSVGLDLVYVADLNKIQVTAYFDEPDVGNLSTGQPVEIVWDAKPGRVWHGHISIPPSTIVNYQNTRSVGECIIAVDDPRGELQPDANVTVKVTTAEHKRALSVPRVALHAEADPPYVFRILDDKLVRTPVQTRGGIINDNWAEIVSGLKEGDVVALNPTTNRDLNDGLEVKPVR